MSFLQSFKGDNDYYVGFDDNRLRHFVYRHELEERGSVWYLVAVCDDEHIAETLVDTLAKDKYDIYCRIAAPSMDYETFKKNEYKVLLDMIPQER